MNENELKNKTEPAKYHALGLGNTLAKIADLENELKEEKTSWKRENLQTALRIQKDYLRRVSDAVQQREMYRSHLTDGQWKTNQWVEVMERLKTWTKQAEDEQEQVSYDLFSLLNRPLIIQSICKNCGRLGSILKQEALKNLKSFSDGGWFDAVELVIDQLDYAGEITH